MANKAISTLAVGSSVYLNVGGARTEFLVVQQGNPHAGWYDASCDGTWLLAKDCPVLRQINASGVNSYASGAVDTYLEGDFYNSFDDVAKSAIKQVKIPYVDSDKSVKTGSNGLLRRVFLLSGPELGMNHSNMLSNEGYRLSYFPSSAVAADKRVSNWNGAPVFYWTRSPRTDSTTNMWAVYENGSLTEAGVTNWKGVRPAFILSSDTLIDGNGNVTLPVDLTAHKTLVNGTAYTVQGGKCMVDGTVYNILKGRTLIDGTGWDITLPEPLVMPVKGDLVTMNLDGTDRLYRVLKIVDGTTVEVLGMWDQGVSQIFHDSSNNYAKSSLRIRLNTTWYSALSAEAKAAIVPKSITQDSWLWGASGSPQYSGTYGNYVPGNSNYTISKVSDNYAAIGTDYVYAMSVQEVLDYLSDSSVLVDASAMLRNQNFWKMFWNTTTQPSNYSIPWLRSAYAGSSSNAWTVYGASAGLSYSAVRNTNEVRPAFQIDLSKIDFTIN